MSAETLAVAMRTGTYLETQSWKPLVLTGRLGWVDANDEHRFEWTNAAASASASAPESPLRWFDDDDPFSAAAAGGGGGGRGRGRGTSSIGQNLAGPSAAPPYEREFPEFPEFQEFPRRVPATSTSFFSNEGICGDFGTLTARAGPPASDEPAEDVKFSRVADLSQDFSERVRALGLNSDVYPLALRTCGWDIYDAHEWLDRMLREEERRAAEAGGGVYDRPDGFEYPARSFEGRERVGSTGGYVPPSGGDGWNELGGSFDYRTLDRQDREVDEARRLRAAAGPAPVLAPSNPVGSWGSRRPATDRIKLRNLQNAFPDIDPSVVEDTLYGAEAAGDVDWAAARLNEIDAERRHKMQRDDAAAAAAAAGGGRVKTAAAVRGASRSRVSRRRSTSRGSFWWTPGGPAALSWAAAQTARRRRSWKP